METQITANNPDAKWYTLLHNALDDKRLIEEAIQLSDNTKIKHIRFIKPSSIKTINNKE